MIIQDNSRKERLDEKGHVVIVAKKKGKGGRRSHLKSTTHKAAPSLNGDRSPCNFD